MISPSMRSASPWYSISLPSQYLLNSVISSRCAISTCLFSSSNRPSNSSLRWRYSSSLALSNRRLAVSASMYLPVFSQVFWCAYSTSLSGTVATCSPRGYRPRTRAGPRDSSGFTSRSACSYSKNNDIRTL